MFYVIIRGRNCEKYIEKCIRSLERQHMRDFQEVLILDAPTDGTLDIVKNTVFKDRTLFYHTHLKRMGLCFNIYYGVQYAAAHFPIKDDDVIAFLDADDYLSKRALHVVRNVYENTNCLVTYGSYIKLTKKRKTRVSKPYGKNDVVRRARWHASHLKTFKYKVWKHINEDCFKDDKGNWGEAASDLAVMFSAIEVAGMDRCQHISDAIHYWRDNYKGTTNRKLQAHWEKVFRKKKPLKRVEFE